MQRISASKIIDLIYRDFKPSDSNWIGDAWDMIGEAVEGIGYHIGFDPRAEEITISGHRARLPVKFKRIDFVEYDGYHLPLGGDKTTYNIASSSQPSTEIDPYRLDKLTRLIEQWNALEEQKEGASPGDIIIIQEKQDELSEQIAKLVSDLKITGTKPYYGQYYQLTDEYIYTSFESGTITMHGIIFPTDENNVPFIIDTVKYRQACFYWVSSRLLMQGYKHPVLDYAAAEERWDHYRKQAANQGKIMGVAAQDRFAKMWTRFKPDPYEASTMLKLLER